MIFRKEVSGVLIDIQLKSDTGIFYLPPFSGVGKTWLAKMLRKVYLSGGRVNSYSYEDYLMKTPLRLENLELMLIDRYDMYYGFFSDEIREFSKSGIVLMDCKQAWQKINVQSCSICRNYSSITVR